MEVQSGAERKRFVTTVTDEAVELTDAAPEVGLTPDLAGGRRNHFLQKPEDQWQEMLRGMAAVDTCAM